MRLPGCDFLRCIHAELGPDLVHLVHHVLHVVVSLRDGGPRKGVGLTNIGTGGVVFVMNLANGIRLHSSGTVQH